MKSDAVVFPTLAAIVFSDQSGLRAERLEGDRIVDCTPQARLLLSSGAETKLIDGASQRDLRSSRLRFEITKHRALALIIAGADPELQLANRRSTLKGCEALLASADVRQFVEARLLGCPPPSEADFLAAETLATNEKALLCAAAYNSIRTYGEFIEPVFRRYRQHIVERSSLRDKWQALTRLFVDSGVIAESVRAVGRRNGRELATLALDYANRQEFRAFGPRVTELISAVCHDLATDFEIPRNALHIIPTGCETEDRWLLEISSWIAEREQKKQQLRGRRLPWKDTDELQEKVSHQVEYVKRLLEKQDLAGADDAVLDLIRHQRKNAQLEHVCKSLSRLGAIAVDYCEYDFAKRLYLAAQTANEFDRVALSGYAEMLRETGLLDEALAIHAATKIQFPDDPVPFCAYAETLRRMGRLDEALEAYAEAKEQFPDSVVAFSGYVEILRDTGRLQTALEAYSLVKERFDDDPAPFGGYAETLRDTGNLEEALSAYASAMKRFPDNTIVFNGYAETLREMGRLSEALSAYERAKKRFPNDRFAANGYAETLRQMGRLEDALRAYAKSKEEFRASPVAYSGYAETLRDLGRMDAAAKAYREAVERFPTERVIRNAVASLMVNMGNATGALALLQTDASPRSKHDWRDFHVGAMAHLRLGQNVEAIRRLEYGARYATIYRVRSLFRCTLAVQRLREQRTREAIELLDLQNKIVPFPEWLVISAHVNAEASLHQKARADLAQVKSRHHLQPAIQLLKEVYGLEGHALPQTQRDRAVNALWEEEFQLLTALAA